MEIANSMFIKTSAIGPTEQIKPGIRITFGCGLPSGYFYPLRKKKIFHSKYFTLNNKPE